LKQLHRGVFYKALGIGACVRCNLRKLDFLLRCEMYFREAQTKGKPRT